MVKKGISPSSLPLADLVGKDFSFEESVQGESSPRARGLHPVILGVMSPTLKREWLGTGRCQAIAWGEKVVQPKLKMRWLWA